ncbi:hypothetical protein [Streptomyces sp. NPDC056796]|uniref:COG4315 family predicted lipoprotein n=1 Tax=unclassified Streptomyces TaxID=2593676 RepID=UPI0036AD4E40
MKRTARAAASAAAVLFAGVLTGCSDRSGSSPGDGYGTAASPAAEQATVDAKATGMLGTILIDDKGHTLYIFLADKKNKSNCAGSCAAAWPPLLSKGAAKAGSGVDEKLLDVTKRSDGSEQVTYNGHPLYSYTGDTKAGQTNGQNLDQFGAKWYVLDSQGNQVTS